MAGVSTVGRQAIRRFAEHEHEELVAGIDRIHELGAELASTARSDRRQPISAGCSNGSTRILKPLWPGRRPGSSRPDRRPRSYPVGDPRGSVRPPTDRGASRTTPCARPTAEANFPSHDTVTLAADLSGLEALLRANVEREERFLLPIAGTGRRRPWEPRMAPLTTGSRRRPPISVRASNSGPRRKQARSTTGGSLPTRTCPRPWSGVPARSATTDADAAALRSRAVDYWVSEDGRGSRRTLTHDSSMPRSEGFSWGLSDSSTGSEVSNEYLTFGGHLDAALGRRGRRRWHRFPSAVAASRRALAGLGRWA